MLIIGKFNKACFIQQNQQKWQIEGGGLRLTREKLGISRAEVARMTSFSTATLAKFKNGEPIMNRKYLISSYRMVLDYIIQKLVGKINSFEALSLI